MHRHWSLFEMLQNSLTLKITKKKKKKEKLSFSKKHYSRQIQGKYRIGDTEVKNVIFF